MSSIMRMRSGLTRRSGRLESIGVPLSSRRLPDLRCSGAGAPIVTPYRSSLANSARAAIRALPRERVRSLVESRCGAVAVGWAYLFPPLSSGGASLAQPWLRFHIPLIEPDVQISRIRLSDKASRLRPRLTAPARGQAYQAKMAVQMREWIAPAPSSPDLVLETQPPAQPHRGVGVESAIRP